MSSRDEDRALDLAPDAPEAGDQEAKELIEQAHPSFLENLVLTYGEAVRAVVADNAQLLAKMESGDPELQKMALLALGVRHVSHPRIVEICADYIVGGEQYGLRWLGVLYLGAEMEVMQNLPVSELLEDCARRIKESVMSSDDTRIVKHIGWCISAARTAGKERPELGRGHQIRIMPAD